MDPGSAGSIRAGRGVLRKGGRRREEGGNAEQGASPGHCVGVDVESGRIRARDARSEAGTAARGGEGGRERKRGEAPGARHRGEAHDL